MSTSNPSVLPVRGAKLTPANLAYNFDHPMFHQRCVATEEGRSAEFLPRVGGCNAAPMTTSCDRRVSKGHHRFEIFTAADLRRACSDVLKALIVAERSLGGGRVSTVARWHALGPYEFYEHEIVGR